MGKMKLRFFRIYDLCITLLMDPKKDQDFLACKNTRPTISPPQILQVPLEYSRIYSFEEIYLAKKSQKALILLKT